LKYTGTSARTFPALFAILPAPDLLTGSSVLVIFNISVLQLAFIYSLNSIKERAGSSFRLYSIHSLLGFTESFR
jgi:hypothetical protein